MRLRIAFLALAAAIPALPQTTSPPPPLLNTGLPNAYPTLPPPVTGASSTSPLLIPNLSGGLPPSGPGPCQGSPNPPPCILPAQVNNARQNVSLYENVFTTSMVTGNTGVTRQQFQVDHTHLPPVTNNPNNNNPVYAQPLYESNVAIPNANCVNGATCNVLYVATLNGEAYAFDADYNASNIATCSNGGPGHSGCLWARDDVNGTTAQTKGLKHNCDQSPTNL